jgi:predicted lipid-binding transport protein (Tim44 family)
MSRWLGPIAGLAAGLGLAALLSHFGLSETFASFLLIALLVVGGILLVRFLLARRSAPAPMQYAGASTTRIEPQMARTTPAFEPVMTSASSAPTTNRFPPDSTLPHSPSKPSSNSASCRLRTTTPIAPRSPT